ncbi:MAG: GNAT family N-acetyltransferase [Chloroflexota bacterium]
MEIAPLTSRDTYAWAMLLAVCFERTPADMVRLLGWLQNMGQFIAWGAWDGDRLAAQYACLLRPLHTPDGMVPAGMSINMAVHPDYRGRGLVRQVAAPVYDTVRDCGGEIGLGFSNAAGVKVDRHSKGYGYRVVGQMQPLIGLPRRVNQDALYLTDTFPADGHVDCAQRSISGNSFMKSPADLCRRYAAHPFRQYRYGVLREGDGVRGVVVYREVMFGGMRGVALLDAIGDDLPALIQHWGGAVHADGASIVHALTTPDAPLRHALGAAMPIFRQPYTRNPHYLTVKSLNDKPPDRLYDFKRWYFTGGDIL